MNIETSKIGYKKGEVYLCTSDLYDQLNEVEILDIVVLSKLLLIKEKLKCDERWVTLKEFHDSVKGYLGVYRTTGKWWWKKRVLFKAEKM